ncbi:Rv3235 family protein [Cellulosimicrobium sp. NPDC057127]|uniref:Rv3235 family protein n=1 Tax=Cellulosimicrobium sp. NPDC057127 TaxID=3346026 RepID=UPI003641E0E0
MATTSLTAPAPTALRSTSVPAAPTGRLLRCVGERPVTAVDVRDRDARPRVPRHLAGARPLSPAAPVPLPDPTSLCCAVVRAAIEVLRGERTVQQLTRWVTPQIYDALARRARLVLEAPGPAETAARPVTIRRARVMRLGAEVAEATVVVDDGGRVRAAAARLEARRGAWRVVALEIG